LLISPHKHKTAQEQFEKRTHIRKIWILEPNAEDIAKLNKLIIPHTVGIDIKENFLT
jgi:ribosomal protein S10